MCAYTTIIPGVFFFMMLAKMGELSAIEMVRKYAKRLTFNAICLTVLIYY